MNSEKLMRYLEIMLYCIVLGSMFISSDAPFKTQFYYYGMRGTSRVMRWMRHIDIYFAEHYFQEVNN